jgi:hypothetical protein
LGSIVAENFWSWNKNVAWTTENYLTE